MKDKKKIFFAGALLIILVLSILIVALLTNNKTKEKIFYEDGNFKLYTQIDNLSSKEEKSSFKKCVKENICYAPLYINGTKLNTEKNTGINKNKSPQIVDNILFFETVTIDGNKNLNLINKYNFIDTLENIDSYGFENNTLEVTFSKENMGPFKNLTISYKIENNKIAIKDVKNVQKNSYKEIFSNIEYDKLNNPIEEYDYEKINEIAFKDHFKIKSKTIYVNSDGKLSFHDDLSLPREEPLNGKYSVQVKQINNSYISKTSNKKGTKITIYDKYLNLIKESYIVEEDDYIGLSLIKNYYLIYAVQNGKDLDIYEYDTVKNTNTKAETIDSSLIIRTLRDLTSKAKTYLEGETLLYAKKAKGPFADYFTHNGKTIYLNTKGEISFNKVEDINEKEILMFDNYVSAVHYIDEHYVYIYVNYEKSTLDQIKIYDKNLKSIDNKTLTSSIEPHINTGNIYYSNNKCNDKKESITEIYRYNIKTKKILTAFVINNGSNMCEK